MAPLGPHVVALEIASLKRISEGSKALIMDFGSGNRGLLKL